MTSSKKLATSTDSVAWSLPGSPLDVKIVYVLVQFRDGRRVARASPPHANVSHKGDPLAANNVL
jgi:hypothetical protein